MTDEIFRNYVHSLGSMMGLTELAERGAISEKVCNKLRAIADKGEEELGNTDTSAEGSAHRALEDAAKRYRQQASKTGNPLDVALARTLEAAWQAETRRQRTSDDSKIVSDLEKLTREADRYLATRDYMDDHLVHEDLPPAPGEQRTQAVRELLSVAGQCKQLLASERTAHMTAGVSAALVDKVRSLGLSRTARDRASSLAAAQWLKRKLLSAPSARDDQLASWALQACGVWSKDADNWVGSAIRPKKTSDS